MSDGRSKIRDRKKKEQVQKIDDILNAARKVFFQKGYIKTTMDEIAYEAALSKPTIYKYFPTKEDLYFSLVLPVLRDCLHEMEDLNLQLQLNMFNSGAKLFRNVMNVFLKKYMEDPDMFRIGQLFQQAGMLWTLDKKTEDSIRELSKAVMHEMRSIFESAVSRGLVRDLDRHVLTEIMIGSFFGITQFQDIKKREKGSGERMRAVMNTAMDIFISSIVLN